ncbi:MAG: high-affinity branched-chain amino acid transporter ATP-binding protein [Rhodospirillales bacterium]|nr:high-affinity branched-chain amino acid transporter ATP-binding protein [Rhodospirillales bacterium]
MTRQRVLEIAGLAVAAAALVAFPALDVPAFYVSFLYMVFFWIAMATSWTILSGFAGYWSFGHAAFFGAGLYTSATLATKFGVPFLLTLPLAAGVAALLGSGIGFVVFRVQRLRGELFALLTISVTFVIAAIISNTAIDGGAGVNLMNVHLPEVFGSPTGTIYLLGLAMAALSLWAAWRIFRSRLGLGLLAIHDDEDVAEVKGVPTFRYKLAAFALSAGIAGAAGGVHAIYVGYVTVGETFEITVTMYPVVMSILGGARHWLGPALGATIVTGALYGFASGPEASLGRAGIALGLIVVVLLLPGGVMPGLIRLRHALRRAPDRVAPAPGLAAVPKQCPAQGATPVVALDCRGICKTFGGVQALKDVDLAVLEGEILGLVGPNGSGKSTLINVVTGHHRLDRGTIALAGARIDALPAHGIARLGIARTYQIPRPFNRLSVLDNVALAARFGPLARGRADAYAEAAHWLGYTGIARRADALPGQLNLHERKFLELARALAARPRILLLDEVLSGLNHTEIDAALDLIRDIRAGGTTIVFVEHLMRAVVALSDRVAVLNDGAVIAIGTPHETMREAEVVKVYLGKAHAS